jgi:hypothetical protein
VPAVFGGTGLPAGLPHRQDAGAANNFSNETPPLKQADLGGFKNHQRKGIFGKRDNL